MNKIGFLLVLLFGAFIVADINIPILDIKWQIENAQFTYNRNLDRIFSIGFLQPWTENFNKSLDKLMETFCMGNDFISWNSFFGVLTTVPTRDGTRAKYADLSINLFQNASRHIISNPIVIPYIGNDGRLRALWNSSSSQFSFALQADGTHKPTQSWGYYHHTWLFTNGEWCMQKFFADTIAFIIRPFDQLPYFVTDPNIL
jgi:hypothetical protein